MARLFITPRELNFISDITKEIIKDVIGQKIYYYPISEVNSSVRGVYNESMKKVFDNPVIIDCIVDSEFQEDTQFSEFGPDSQYKIEAFIQYRDLIEKGIKTSIGDFFSFSDIFYEVSELVSMKNIFGLPEHKSGIKVIGTKVRESQFKAAIFGPTDIRDESLGSVQEDFYQQRGFVENEDGETGDFRQLRENGVLSEPIGGPAEVSNRDNSPAGSTFYDEI